MLAPLAGIGNWFVRLQAKRYGAGLVVSEMVSSFAVHYRNERTCRELLRIHPDEHPVSIQLFGHDPEVMASAAERVADAGADLIDLNMGCPVPKVCKTGAGAALLDDPDKRGRDRARGRARAAACRSRSSCARASGPGERSGVELARRLVGRPAWRASASTRATPPSSTRARPTTSWPRELVEELPVPVIVSGGLHDADARARRRSSAPAPRR